MDKKEIIETINYASQLITRMRLKEVIKEEDETRLINIISDIHSNLTSPLTVTVVGPFNSGKSTFINALIEEKILPTSINPSTSMVCRIGYCNTHLKIQYLEKGNVFVKQITTDEMQGFVDRNSSNYIPRPGDVLEIFHNNNFCEKDIVVVDTPGFNDPSMDDEVTNNALENADAVIYCMHVSQANSRLDEEKIKYLQKTGITSIFFVIGYLDLLKNAEKTEIESLKARLRKELSSKSILREDGVFFVSAADKLDRIEKKVDESHEAEPDNSGIDEVRKKIWEFLIDNRMPIKNKIAINKIDEVRTELELIINQKIEILQNALDGYLQKKEQLKRTENEAKVCIASINRICTSYEENAYKFIKLQIETEILNIDSKIEEWVDEVFETNLPGLSFGLNDNVRKTVDEIQNRCKNCITAAVEERIVPFLNSTREKMQAEILHTVEKYIISIELGMNKKITLPALRLEMETTYSELIPDVSHVTIAGAILMMERNMIPLIGKTFAPIIGILIAVLGLGLFQFNRKKKKIISNIRTVLRSREFSTRLTQIINDSFNWSEEIRPTVTKFQEMTDKCVNEQNELTNQQVLIKQELTDIKALTKDTALINKNDIKG